MIWQQKVIQSFSHMFFFAFFTRYFVVLDIYLWKLLLKDPIKQLLVSGSVNFSEYSIPRFLGEYSPRFEFALSV